MRRYRITFLTVIPAPYQCELFEAVARHPGLEPRVYYYTERSPGSRWVVPPMPPYAEILPGLALHGLTRCCCLNPAALRRLRSEPSDLVVVADYFTLTAQLVMRDLTRRGVSWVFWGEIPGLNKRSLFGNALRRFAQRPVVRGARAAVAIGSRAADAYRELLGDDRSVFNIPYHCDLSAYLGIPRLSVRRGPVRFLFSGQLIERKGVDTLIEAFVSVLRRFAGGANPPELILLGDGAERARYEAMVPDEFRGCVSFQGFCDPAALPDQFAQADVFVLPSRHDGWGVVVNEAIGAGMPVIATTAVGAAHDLIEPGRNGFMVAPDDASGLASAMNWFVDRPASISTYGECSRQIARNWTVARGAQRWYDVCEAILEPQAAVMPEVFAEPVPA